MPRWSVLGTAGTLQHWPEGRRVLMFDVEFDDLDLGAPRNQVQWVAFAPPQVVRPKQVVHKRCDIPATNEPIRSADRSWSACDVGSLADCIICQTHKNSSARVQQTASRGSHSSRAVCRAEALK